MRWRIFLLPTLLLACVPAVAGAQAKAASLFGAMPQPELAKFVNTLRSNLSVWRQIVYSADISSLHGSYPASGAFVPVVQGARQQCLSDLGHLLAILGNMSPMNLLLNVEVLHSLPALRSHVVVLTVNLQIYSAFVPSSGNGPDSKDKALLNGWSEQLGSIRQQIDSTDLEFDRHVEGLALNIMQQCNLEEDYPNCGPTNRAASQPR